MAHKVICSIISVLSVL